jgi:hypothetical protein
MMPSTSATVAAHKECPSSEPLSATESIKRELERNVLEQLPWPTDMFGNYASIAELISGAAELAGGDKCRDDVCRCSGQGTAAITRLKQFAG